MDPVSSQESLNVEAGGRVRGRVGRSESLLAMAGFEDGRRGQARERRQPPRCWKRQENIFSSRDSRKDCSLADTLILAHAQVISVVSNSETLWTVAHQAPLTMGFSRQEYWSGLPCPPPGGLSNPEIGLTSLLSPALAGRFFTTRAT